MFYTFFLSTFVFATLPEKSFYLDGHISEYRHTPKYKVYLLKMNQLSQLFGGSSLTVVDSADIDNSGHFRFSNEQVVEDSMFYRLNIVDAHTHAAGAITMMGSQENFAFFLLTRKSQIEFVTDATHFNDKMKLIRADKTNRLIGQIANLRRHENRVVDSLIMIREHLDSHSPSYGTQLKSIYASIANSMGPTWNDLVVFADTVSDSYASLLAASYLPVDDFRPFLSQLANRYKVQMSSSRYTEQFNSEVNGGSQQLEIGTHAPNISLPDAEGQIVSLANMKGKYVLIDFWASWCSPCRAESKNTLKPLYSRHHNKPFTIYSISQDLTLENWQKAIAQDATSDWINVSDLRGAASEVMTLYNIPYLPYNYLIDPDGIIIARNLHGAELESFLDRILTTTRGNK